MSAGFNIETYQIGKQDGIKSGTGKVPQEVLDRIQKLENSQMNIANEYYCDFSKDEYMDYYKSTVQNTGSGIVPKQHKNNWFYGFENDDIIDYNSSKNIIHDSTVTNMMKIDKPTTQYGELYTSSIKLDPFIGFKFNANIKIPITENLEGQQELKSGCLWFAKGVDNYGRLWVFRADTYKYEEGSVYLTIYNRDMTIYKENTIPAISFFGNPSVVGTYKYSLVHNSATIIFSEENLCIIGFTCTCSNRNGVNWDVPCLTDGNQVGWQKNFITFINEDGHAANKYNYIFQQTSGVYNWYVNNNHNQYHGLIQCFEPCKLSIQKNRVYYVSPCEARWFGYYNYDQNRMLRCILIPETGLLDDVGVTISNVPLVSAYYEANNTNYMNWSARFGTKMFKRGDTTYHFITDYAQCKSPLPLSRMYLAEVKINDNTSSFDVDNCLALNGTLSYPMYGFGGANGMYYCERYNYLYIFSNAYNSELLYITRYEVDWTSKTSTAITLKNPKTRNIQLAATTYWGDAVTWGNDTDFRWHYNEKLKVHEDQDKLCLLYGNRNPLTLKQQINYMSIDFDLDIVQGETQIHKADAAANSAIVSFDVEKVDGKNIIMYTQGDKNDFNDTTAESDSHLYATVSTLTSSRLTFYYATDTDVTWKFIAVGEEKNLNKLANEIKIKAVLEANNRYDTSPEIRGLYIESWDNNKQDSRQSEYYSNQISTIQNEGKAVLTADYDLNNGTIDWYVSYDGGKNFSKVTLGEEFVYTHVETPDFRIKAVLSVTDNAKKLPIVRSYTLKSNHVVLHSDLEELQINLMKTNFKIDTLSRASRNGLFKMFVDVFSDEAGVDKSNSDYVFYEVDGAVGGNFIVTKPQHVDSNTVTVLLATSEVLDTSKENSHINYFASLDKGVNYTEIYPNIKAQLSNTNSTSNNLIIKAVFYDNAKLSALGVAWD